MNKFQSLKRFGQNYLVDKNIIRKLVDVLDPKPEDKIIEIGPGYGSITEELLNRVNNITAVEIDKRINEELIGKFPKLTLINNDVLKIDFSQLFGTERKLRFIGNIPFNITSQIIFKLLEHNTIINDCVFIVQHEVAKRITASKGTKDYGILSVVLSFFTNVKYCFKISPSVFRPKPKVYSAVVHIQFKNQTEKDINEKLFIKVVKASFGNRRKTLKNSLTNSIFSDCNFDDSGIVMTKRAEELSLIDFIQLTKFLTAKGYG